jgi:hypothetical protein
MDGVEHQRIVSPLFLSLRIARAWRWGCADADRELADSCSCGIAEFREGQIRSCLRVVAASWCSSCMCLVDHGRRAVQ